MNLPNLTKDDVEAIVQGYKVIGPPMKGGQKLVFPCEGSTGKFALKFLLIDNDSTEDSDETTVDLFDEISARANREVETINACDSPYLIKLGPIGIQSIIYNGQKLVFFSEEWIIGDDVSAEIKNNKVLEIKDIVKLGIQISQAINELWKCAKIHRDIKPGNILHSSITGDFILLDMGMAFDLNDKSLTAIGRINGTKAYVSPEQLNIAKRRQMDFRSDLFNLGIVMYEAITGVHPFYKRGMTDDDLFTNILIYNPPAPSTIRSNVPKELDAVIGRLLGKSPHFRFRSCTQLIEALETILKSLEVQ